MKRLKFLIDVFLIVLFLLFTAYFTNRAGYLALWGDGYAHATKIKFLVTFWPNINWVYFWGNGIPVFLWYGFMPYAFLVFFYKIFSQASMAINAVNLLAFILIGIGIYGIVYEVSQSRLASLLAAFLAIPSPGLWYRIMVGTTPRTLGDGFLVLAIWFLVKALRQEKASFRLSTFWGLVVFTSLAFQSHFFTFLITSLFALVIILVVAQGLGGKIKFLFLTFLPALFLAFYFLFPFALTQYQTQAATSIGLFKVDPLNLKLLFYHPPQAVVIPGGGLLPIHLPLLIIFLPLVFVLGRLKEKPFVKRVILAFLSCFFFFFIFGTAIYFGYPASWYNVGFVPDEAFEFLSLVIPVILGICFWLALPKNWLRTFSVTVLAILIILVIWQYPLRYPLQVQVPFESDPHAVYDQNLIWQMLKEGENEKNYRYAHPATEIALWFNYESKIPQNREFFPHGVMHPNWRSWQENAIWNPAWNEKMNETKFLLDWFAIRWLSFLPPGYNLNTEKYKKDADFELKGENLVAGESGYEFKKATPILSATNVPAILVIGERSQDRSFGPIMRILATFNLSSQVIIPVRGKSFLDGYKTEELARFPLIFLYEYRIKNPQKAGQIVRNYLEQGGKVMIESSSFLSDNKREVFEGVLGFQSKSGEVKEGKWNFSPVQTNLTEEIDFSRFSPPLFEGEPWKYFRVEQGIDQEPILSNKGEVVIFRQKVGKGELVWSGLNLPYHALSYQNQEEKRFLVKIIFGLLGEKPKVLSPPKNIAEFVNPQKRTVEILAPANGVLFKENYFFNWRAILEKDSRQTKLKIYPAGTDFMYIPFGKSESSGKVTIFYRRSLMEKASTAVSLISLLALVTLAIYSWKFGPENLKKILTESREGLVGRLSKWWHKEDEE
ncbi:MAG: 6-pyruvoyl-tetrahydropterin synthase-related protein [Patescibacteria group bacterium]